jgi:hypothetical protein
MTKVQSTLGDTGTHQPVYGVLGWLVAGTAAAVILIEIALTRLFSVLLYYHYSFLAVALALFGLAAGGLSASRLRIDLVTIVGHLRQTLRRAAIALLGLVLLLVLASPSHESVSVAFGGALVSAVPLFLLGKALALTMALGRSRIHRLYAIDLLASGAAALFTIPLLARVQGPMVLAVPALVAIALDAVLSSPRQRIMPYACALVLGTALVWAAIQDRPLLPLNDPWPGTPVTERWNAYSRVRVSEWAPDQRILVIDKAAASLIPRIPPDLTQSQLRDLSRAYDDPSYLLGRRPERVAIIGVGGGPDILPALSAGATRIDGYELNGRIVELLQNGLDGYTTLAHRPEVRLIHDEARHALQHQPQHYDIIRANLIDTWAATAAGGFVLAENGIYTVEAWRLFLTRLTPRGILVMTRWYLPAAPAEAQRLVSLAAEALEAEGHRTDEHLIAMALPASLPAGLGDPLAGGRVQTITTIASQQAFSNQEVKVLKDFAESRGGSLLVWPGQPPAGSASWVAMVTPSRRQAYVDASVWDIEPPTDERPFFFLQLRPRDVLRFRATNFGLVSAITVNGVRILLITAFLAAVAAAVVTGIATRGGESDRLRLPARGRVYFALLGGGYMAVQLALLQRLTLILGHPTNTLALVIATMLLGTGAGSALAGIGRFRAVPGRMLVVPLLALGSLMIGFGHLGDLSRVSSVTAGAVACGGVAGLMGLALGIAFPTGVRLFARSDLAVTEAWTLNGAFSVFGSAAGALGGLLLGSRGLIAAAIPCYLLAWLIVLLNTRSSQMVLSNEEEPHSLVSSW